MENKYDVIIIGSGMGALTVASLLAQFKEKKILLLERHFKAGGFTHTFKRKRKFLWDVGVHYVGDVQPGGLLRTLFDILTKKGLQWKSMPDLFEKFVYPDFTFDVYNDREKYKADLITKFPQEKQAIENYFSDIQRMNQWFARNVTLKGKAPLVDKLSSSPQLLGSDKTLLTTKEYFDDNFKDAKLKAVLASQWGDYGLPPSLSAFCTHCAVVSHYLNGGYYPVGSAAKIAETIIPIIEAAGGEILLNHEVKEIIIEDGVAIGVKAYNERATGAAKNKDCQFYAPLIISNAGAYTTYHKLIPAGFADKERHLVEQFYKNHPVTTNVTLYLGLNDDPSKLGFKGENYWMYSSYDHDENFSKKDHLLDDSKPSGAYLSFPSLKDDHVEAHTAEIIAFTNYDSFAKWNSQPWKKRDEEYQALKEKIANKLIDYVNDLYPGFKDLIEFKELSTPLSTEYFTGHPGGSIYGVANVLERFKEDDASFTKVETPVKNLLLTGVDVSSPGIAGAVMGGIATANFIDKKLALLKLVRK